MNARFETKQITSQALAWCVVAVLAPALIVGCSQAGAEHAAGQKSKGAAPEDALRVQTVSVEPRDLARRIELPGTVEGYETADLYARIGGYLAEISVDIGDQVSQGQVLARLSIPEREMDLRQKQAAIAAAEADVEQSKAALYEAKTELREKEAQLNKQLANFQRIKGLVDHGSLQEKLLDEARYEREAAQAALDTVQAHIQTADFVLKASAAKVVLAKAELDKVQTWLEYGEIRAPFDGMITKRFVHPGAFIQPADGNSSTPRPLLTVTRIDVVRISLDLPMAEVRWLDRGDRVVFDRVTVLPDARFEGEIARFATALDPTSRMMRVEIDLQNPDHQLLPGYYGYVTVMLDEMPQTPVVPSSALFKSGSGSCVYVVENGICHRREVTTCFQDGTLVGIDSGLRAGEQVVQAGAGQLREGQQVVAVNAGA